MNTKGKRSILDMAMGAIKSQVDHEMAHIIDNILDLNTKAAKKRSVTVTIDITPDDSRQKLRVSSTVKCKLEPTNPVEAALYITKDEDGAPVSVEMVAQIPGQLVLDGGEQAQPVVLNLIREG